MIILLLLSKGVRWKDSWEGGREGGRREEGEEMEGTMVHTDVLILPNGDIVNNPMCFCCFLNQLCVKQKQI